MILLGTLLVVIVVGVAAFIYLLTVPPPLEHWLQARMLLALREHYQTDVQLQNLRVTLIPTVNATADNFVLPNRNHGDVPPLITVKHLIVEANLIELLLRSPVHLSVVKLEGMEIKVASEGFGPETANWAGTEVPHPPGELRHRSRRGRRHYALRPAQRSSGRAHAVGVA